jgi:hypothetical protein
LVRPGYNLVVQIQGEVNVFKHFGSYNFDTSIL